MKSIAIPLGRCDLCLSVNDINKSFEFYQALGFNHVEGKLDEKWSVLMAGNFRLGIYQDMFKGFSLNFRGGNVQEISLQLQNLNIKFVKEFKSGKEGGGSATIEDPDGYPLFFDTHHTELGLAEDVEKLEDPFNQRHQYLGTTDVCLDVKDVAKSYDFYASLGFSKLEGDPSEDWLVVTSGNLRLGLISGTEKKLTINFRGADIDEITKNIKSIGYKLLQDVKEEDDGTIRATMFDPDNYLIYFNS